MILGLFGYSTAQHAGGGSNSVQRVTGLPFQWYVPTSRRKRP